MAKKRNLGKLEFEEAILDSFSGEFEVVESPLPGRVFKLTLIVVSVLSALFVGRVIILGAVEGNFYRVRASANVNKEIYTVAPRGVIYDRYGEPLVDNVPIFSLFLKPSEMFKNNEEGLVAEAFQEILSVPSDKFYEALRNSDLESTNDILLFQDITVEQAINLEGRGLTSLRVEDDYKRQYKGPAFSHFIGYVGLANKGDFRSNPELTLNDIVGKIGVEAAYDGKLRGENGLRVVYRDFKGESLGEREVREVQVGDDLRTTIDAEFQQYFYERFADELRFLGRSSGVGLALNPQNGEVLAMLSFPSFDANVFSSSGMDKERLQLLQSELKPLFNRAASGAYNPGSAIKPLHAFGALNEGVVTPEREVLSTGYIEIPNPYFPDKPSRFVDWKPHGWVNLYSAIARSSNVYFYYVVGGFQNFKGLGIERLRQYWKMFGLGEPTGVDFPSEAQGFLPSPEEKEERTGSIWRVGDTYNVSIGQGDLLVTPLQLLVSTATIINGGYLYQPTVTFDYRGVRERLTADYSKYDNHFKEVRTGLEDTVQKSYGTAHLLSDLPFSSGGKTGSAQIAGNTKTNAFFVGYAPADKPEIIILVLVEDAREGSLNAVPIARDVLRWYYENRLRE